MTDLRELVEMLPGDVASLAPIEWSDVSWCPTGWDREQIISEDQASDMLLGYLVRWLGERGWVIQNEADDDDENKTVYLGYFDSFSFTESYPTPIEAAVRAVGAVENSK